MQVAWIPAFLIPVRISSLVSGLQQIKRLPEPMRPRGEMSNASQILWVCGNMGMRFISIRMRCLPAMPNSVTAVASPPSVTSCMAVTPPISLAIPASSRMLMWSKNCLQEWTSESLNPIESSLCSISRAMMAVPSTATDLVINRRSPVFMDFLSIRQLLRTVPAREPTTTGLVTASVISVCPPHRVIPYFDAIWFSPCTMC